MGAEPIRLRESCLIERALACAAGFEDIGCQYSADFTRDLARQIRAGLPSALFEHWVTAQEQRLADKRYLRAVERLEGGRS